MINQQLRPYPTESMRFGLGRNGLCTGFMGKSPWCEKRKNNGLPQEGLHHVLQIIARRYRMDYEPDKTGKTGGKLILSSPLMGREDIAKMMAMGCQLHSNANSITFTIPSAFYHR